MSRIVVVLAVLLAVLVPVPGQAVFHFANIDEIMSGKGGDSTAQYVEIRMLSAFQGDVAHSRLTAFSCDGSPHAILLEVPGNVCPANAGGRWTMGTTSWAAATGVTPDFIFPASAAFANGCGMICWGADNNGLTPPPNPPTWDAGVPDNYNPDCVAYGGYTGTRQSTDTAASTLTAGSGTQSLQRMADTSNDSADFAFATPTPTNNGTCTTTTSTKTTTTPPGTGPSKCSSKEIAAAGKKAGGTAKCWSKATKKALPVDSACLGTAETKFSAAYSKAMGKGDCINTTPAGTIETKVDNFITDLATEINGGTGTPTASKCSSKELSTAGKKAGGVIKCYAKAAGKATPTDTSCTGAAATKFGASWTKATAAGDCNTTVSQGDIETKVDNFAADVNAELTATGATTTTTTTTRPPTTTTTSTTTTTTRPPTTTTTTRPPTTTTTSTSTTTTNTRAPRTRTNTATRR